MSAVISVEGLRKQYRTAFLMRRVDAVKNVSFEVQEGQVFGFLGPNGAGKTTTIRVLMGLIRATEGQVELFGEPIPNRSIRKRIGFLPESPYFYDYLTVTELLDLAGRLCGVPRATRKKRSDELIDLVGLDRARHVRLKKYSKGMLQRAGIAQALINDPDLVVFDEPMSGLDPVGRKEVRDIILDLGERGKTVFFSTHILADVEVICDHVAFIGQGEIRGSGSLHDLLSDQRQGTEVSLELPEGFADTDLESLTKDAERARRGAREVTMIFGPDVDIDALLARGRDLGASVRSVAPRHDALEQLFIARTMGTASDEPESEEAGE